MPLNGLERQQAALSNGIFHFMLESFSIRVGFESYPFPRHPAHKGHLRVKTAFCMYVKNICTDYMCCSVVVICFLGYVKKKLTNNFNEQRTNLRKDLSFRGFHICYSSLAKTDNFVKNINNNSSAQPHKVQTSNILPNDILSKFNIRIFCHVKQDKKGEKVLANNYQNIVG